MLKTKILTLILAGGEGGRLEVLTDARAKPSLPFGGSYHLIDIPLSNAVNSGLSDVWVVEQYRPHSLNEHLSNGRPWDLDRSRGGLRVLPPYSGGEGEGFASGNAEALYQNLNFLRDFGADQILVLSSDHLYKLDYRDVLERHLAKKAEVTMVTVHTDEDASRFGVVETDAGGRVTGFAYKPDEPKTDQVTAEIFLFDADVLLDTLQTLFEEDEDLGDYGDRLLPRLVENGRAYAFEHSGYWRDLGTPASYWQAHMDLLEDEPEFALDDPDWAAAHEGRLLSTGANFRNRPHRRQPRLAELHGAGYGGALGARARRGGGGGGKGRKRNVTGKRAARAWGCRELRRAGQGCHGG